MGSASTTAPTSHFNLTLLEIPRHLFKDFQPQNSLKLFWAGRLFALETEKQLTGGFRMNTQVFITGQSRIPMTLKKDPTLTCTLIENPYDLRSALGGDESDKIVVVFLPFLEVRHFDLYSFLQKSIKNVKIFFVVNELSSNMKIRLKHNNDFVVLWKTEENNLPKDIHAYLDGRQLELRQDKRETQDTRAMLSPSMLPLGVENRGFQPILGGSFENISLNGSCLKIKAPFYTKKDFINLTYQNKQGEYVSVEGQVRWSKWNETEQSQELGVQFLTQA